MTTIATQPDASATADRAEASPTWRFRILVDGECPLCAKEAKMMAWMDKGRGRLDIEDIADPGFDAGKYGTTFEEVMGHIHGVMPDGSLVTGMEVFRQSYSAVGWGWLLNWTRLPIARQISDAVYRFFARYRLAFTGRKDACESGRCKLPD